MLQTGPTSSQTFTFAGTTTSQTIDNLANLNSGCKGIEVILSTSAIGTGSITLTINAKDTASGGTKLLLSGAAVTTNTTNRYTVYPGVAISANISASDIVGPLFQIVITANNANAATYTVSYALIP